MHILISFIHSFPLLKKIACQKYTLIHSPLGSIFALFPGFFMVLAENV